MANKKRKTIKYNFGDKHKAYIRCCVDNTFNIAEGAVRAGKTIDNVYAFAHELKTTPDKIHLATGSTIANAKLNIGDANGYGLEYIFRGQCRWGKYKDNECLYIKGPDTDGKSKIVIFAGAAKANSYAKIRGNSYGMWIATEINLHHDSSIKEAFNRQLAAQRRKIFWDLNPDNPNAPIYTEYIDKYKMLAEEGTLLGGYNYEHFSIFDNINIPESRRLEIISQYDPNSIWYHRDIEGQRCISEGLIYRQFADNPDKYSLRFESTDQKEQFCRDIEFISLGVDFGGNRSLTTFVATAFHRRFTKITALKDHNIPGRKGEIDSDKVNGEFIGFVQRLMLEYPGIPIKYCFADSEAQYLINGLHKASRKAGLVIQFGDSAKNAITQRIYCGNTLLNTGRLQIHEDCRILRGGLIYATWDPVAAADGRDERLDNFSSDIDILDAWEYSWERFMKQLLPKWEVTN